MYSLCPPPLLLGIQRAHGWSWKGVCRQWTRVILILTITERCLCSGIIIISTRRKQNGREQIWHLVLRGLLWNDYEKCTQPIKCNVLMKWKMTNKIRKRMFRLHTHTHTRTTHTNTHSNTHDFHKGVNTNTFWDPDGGGSNPPLYSVLWIPLKYLCQGAKVSLSHIYYMSHFCPYIKHPYCRLTYGRRIWIRFWQINPKRIKRSLWAFTGLASWTTPNRPRTSEQ